MDNAIKRAEIGAPVARNFSCASEAANADAQLKLRAYSRRYGYCSMRVGNGTGSSDARYRSVKDISISISTGTG